MGAARIGVVAGLLLLGFAQASAQRPGDSAAYTGPLIDSHAHIVNYRPLVEGEGVVYRVDPREGATTHASDTYVAGLDRNNITCVVGFHGIALDGKRDELLRSARRFHERYPARFVLLAEFFRDTALEWFEAQRLAPFFETTCLPASEKFSLPTRCLATMWRMFRSCGRTTIVLWAFTT